MENNGTGSAMPVKASERYMILDILRGFALMGIAVANFPEFALYTFLPGEAVAAMPTAKADCVARWVHYMLIDGKFYTIFSLLFGIGFSIIISNAMCRGADGLKIFYRRMAILAAIGLLHLMLLWSGDILLLYALMGMLLPLFRNATDRIILSWAVAMLLLPVAVDTAAQLAGIYLSAPVVEMQQHCCSLYGITDANFAYWLRDAADYHAVHQFLVQGALVRVQEFIDGNRYFKVLGLLLIGYCIGRHRLYARLEEFRPLLRRLAVGCLAAGLPLSAIYAWSAVAGHPWGNACHSVLYVLSVYPTGMAYVALLCLTYLRVRGCIVFRMFAAPGCMALTCYIGQSVVGILIFYGIGLGLGASMGLVQVIAVAVATFVVQALLCAVWLRWFRFGPLEWIWRMLTYGKTFSLLKKEE